MQAQTISLKECILNIHSFKIGLMMNRIFALFLTLSCSTPLWSFNCYFTLAKDSCWTNYNITVDVVDDTTSTVLTTVSVPSGTPWVRQQFTCQPAQKLMYKARFTPIFWQSDANKTYSADRFWFMPGTINPGDKAWELPVCFPSNFAEVPFPPDATGNCKCDFSVIPTIKPQ